MRARLVTFFKKYELKIVLTAGFVLVAAIAFEGGILKSANFSQRPLVIEQAPAITEMSGKTIQKTAPEALNSPQATPSDPTSSPMPQNCAYVASKNSNLYHLATSSYAKRIKPENQVCFSSPDEAKSKGYAPDKSLAK